MFGHPYTTAMDAEASNAISSQLGYLKMDIGLGKDASNTLKPLFKDLPAALLESNSKLIIEVGSVGR